MRPILFAAAVLAPIALTAATTPSRDWGRTVTPAPSGFWVIGNPAAKVKLVEWASYTCPHCAHFAEQSAPVLKDRMVRSGQVSFELRHLIRDPLDLAAVVVARCGGPRGFPARHAAIFAGQSAWIDKGSAFLQANGEGLGKLPPATAFRRIADGAGLTAIGRAQGLTEPQVAACFADQAALDRVTKLGGSVPAEVKGTPTFYVDGAIVTGSDWASVEPVLRARGAK